MQPDDAGRQPHIITDEDWKERVKAEDAALDAQFRGETAGPSQRKANAGSAALPPVDFSTLVSLFSTQAVVALGVVPNPATNKPEADLPLARHFIDLLGVLEDKTKGNLTDREQMLLDATLHELRLTYVELTRANT